ncbi:hypothetical protein [Photobacterium phosphoreum]|uniref:hypothetical protein n=1 Tax=Photobacterium phosphoreum TaxID=659 RepID=UPI0011B23AC7|nr:hypothetical protein [Photobacterium phosphoreum]
MLLLIAFHRPFIPCSEYQRQSRYFLQLMPIPNPVIPYSEVTNEIGNLLLARCRVSASGGILAYFHWRL